MAAFVARRLVWAAFVLLAVGTIAYLLTFVAPADPARSIAGPRASVDAVERIRLAMGLDRPALVQLADYFGQLLQGDLGVSYHQGGVPVTDLILAKLLPTIQLAIAGVLIAVVIAVPLGVRAARHPGGPLDRVTTILSSVLVSVPSFLLGLLLIYYVAFQWRLAPLATSSYDPLDLRSLALPAITLAVTAIPFYLRVGRMTTLQALRQDYVRTARAKGVDEGRVVWRHAFRNAMLPLLTLVGMDLGFFLGGVVIIESVFSWPGIGQQAVKAITSEDLPVLMGTLLFGTLCIVLINLVVDILYAFLDPRVRTWGGKA